MVFPRHDTSMFHLNRKLFAYGFPSGLAPSYPVSLCTLLFLSVVIPYASVNKGDYDDEDGESEGVFFHIHHIVSQHHFQSRGRQLANEAAQGIGAEMHAGKGRYGGDQAVGHVRDSPGRGNGLPGIVGVQFLQCPALIDDIHGHAAEKGTHDVEGNQNPHRFRQPGNDGAPEQAEYQSVGGGNKNGRKKSYNIDDHINEETHESGINAKAVEIRNGAPEVSIL